ncbi:SpoIVB peptidase S55 domain-containing protein [Candidatus Riflebacteria bacterium]
MTRKLRQIPIHFKIQEIPGNLKFPYLKAFLFFVICISANTNLMAVDYVPLKDLHRGMLGKCKTVFKETRLDEFEVKVLGIRKNFFGPGKGLVLLLGDDYNVNFTGVAAGMSGSPVYFKGKLAGALAWKVSIMDKTPLFGMTPIEEMLKSYELQKTDDIHPSVWHGPVKVSEGSKPSNYKDLNDYFASVKSRFPETMHKERGGITPLLSTLEAGGFSGKTLEKLKSVLGQAGFGVMSGNAGGSGSSLEKLDYPLSGGYPISAALLYGDVSMKGTGTITHRHQNRLLAFGHSMFQNGYCNYAMQKAKIIYTVPSQLFAFKLSSPGQIVGRVITDRNAAIMGIIGKEAPDIKISMQREGFPLERKKIQFNAVKENTLTDMLIIMGLWDGLEAQEFLNREITTETEIKLYYKGHSSPLELSFYESSDTGKIRPPTELANILADTVSLYKNLKLDLNKVEYKVVQRQGYKKVRLEKIVLDKHFYHRGEKVGIKLFLRDVKTRKLSSRSTSIILPVARKMQKFILSVQDAENQNKKDLNFKKTAIAKMDAADYLYLKSNRRKGNQLVLQLRFSESHLVRDNTQVTELPESMRKLVESDPFSALKKPDYTVAGEKTLDFPAGVSGKVEVPIVIKEGIER